MSLQSENYPFPFHEVLLRFATVEPKITNSLYPIDIMKIRKSLSLCAAAALAASALPAAAQLKTYVDASHTGNTLERIGGTYGTFTPFGAFGDQGTANDTLWDVRGFGNGVTIYQNAGTGANVDNANRLQTSVTGLEMNAYNVYAYFWSDSSLTWRMEASLTDNPGGDLPLYMPGSAGVTSFYTGTDATILSSNPAVNGGVNPFTTEVMVAEGNRRLYQIDLGQVTGTGFNVFIDDFAAMTGQAERTWYDGIGYSVVPEPSSFALLGLGAVVSGLLRRRKA